MSITAALELIAMVAIAVAKAKTEGRETVDLMEQAKSLDDDARQHLVDAIGHAQALD